MKTSNKILLGAFITALLLWGGLYAAVYIKYKTGDFNLEYSKEWDKRVFQLHNVDYVFLENVVHISLYSSDSASLQLAKRKDENFKVKFVQRGDSLFISAPAHSNEFEGIVQLHINPNARVRATNSGLSLNYDNDSTFIPSFFLELDSSSVYARPHSAQGKVYYNRLQITARNNSEISLSEVEASGAEISLENSRLNLHNCTIGHLDLKNDRSSQVSFSGSSISRQQK
ncbi:hypothetical protein OCK74_00990 [Chitinophagaceae bacterium LB-8]|uniref:Uncharacterized protein n=1 Tax=Paraflavisolibacter caeni TaxID=2982496 RepID=A0A9X2XSQ7_9BACT|nr:hypothetical protein [Paraflavisolibacter caeni]MCU7547662.1 hypothetical protein [Paraflavisolibacter caeni]